jgi:prepilin-type N-terminal cleavage/methylation domain-containing protein
MQFHSTVKSGFTFIELLIVLAIMAIITSFTFMSLSRPQASTSLDTTIQTLLADIKYQQTKTMAGNNDNLAGKQQFGVYFESNQYVMFTGNSYNSGSLKNRITTLPANIVLTNNFTNSQIIFASGSGEITNYSSGNTLTLTSAINNTTRSIILNLYGVATIN